MVKLNRFAGAGYRAIEYPAFLQWRPQITREEDPNKLYWYDEAGTRFEPTDRFQGIRCPQE